MKNARKEVEEIARCRKKDEIVVLAPCDGVFGTTVSLF